MELGFTHDYLMRIAELTGWTATFHPYPGCGRANIYVLEEAPGRSRGSAADPLLTERVRVLQRELAQMRVELSAMRASTSWRVTQPLRASKGLLARARAAAQSATR